MSCLVGAASLARDDISGNDLKLISQLYLQFQGEVAGDMAPDRQAYFVSCIRNIIAGGPLKGTKNFKISRDYMSSSKLNSAMRQIQRFIFNLRLCGQPTILFVEFG